MIRAIEARLGVISVILHLVVQRTHGRLQAHSCNYVGAATVVIVLDIAVHGPHDKVTALRRRLVYAASNA